MARLGVFIEHLEDSWDIVEDFFALLQALIQHALLLLPIEKLVNAERHFGLVKTLTPLSSKTQNSKDIRCELGG